MALIDLLARTLRWYLHAANRRHITVLLLPKLGVLLVLLMKVLIRLPIVNRAGGPFARIKWNERLDLFQRPVLKRVRRLRTSTPEQRANDRGE